MIGTFQQRPQSKRISQNIQAIRPITRGNAKQQAQKCFKIAKDHMEKNQIDKAIEFYLQAAIHDPNYYQAYCNMGTCFRSLGNFLQAVSSYLKAVHIKPDDSITNYNLANVYRIIGDEQKAVKIYNFVIKLKQEKGLELGSIYSNSYTNLGICYKNVGDYSSAITCYQKAQKLSPNDNSISFNHAMCLKRVLYRLPDEQAFKNLKIEKVQKTRQLFQKVVTADSNNQMARLSLIQLKYMSDKSEQTLTQCIQQFKSLTQKSGTKVQVKQEADQKIAYCLNLLKKYEQSIKQYKKSLQAVEVRKQSIHNLQTNVQKPLEQVSVKEINKYDISQNKNETKQQSKKKIQNVEKSQKVIEQTQPIKKEVKQKIKQNLVQIHLPQLKKLCEQNSFNQCYQKIGDLPDNLQKKQLLIIVFSIQTQVEQNKETAESAYRVYLQNFHKSENDQIVSQMFSLETHKAIASILTFLGKNQLAIKHYEIISQYISKSKDNEEANLTQLHSGLGVNYQSQGLHQKAVEQFKKALELQPENINLLYNLGFCYQSAGKNKQAVQIYRKSLIKINEEDLQVEVRKSYIIDCMINIVYCLEGTDEQLAACQKVGQKLGEFYQNDSTKIVKTLDQSIIMNFYLKMANLYEDQIQKQVKRMNGQAGQQKIKLYKQKLLKIFLILLDFKNCPDRQQILINCGNIFYQQKQYLNSLNFYQRLHKCKDLVVNNIALALLNLNQYERALNNMIYATQCQPQNYVYKINFAIICWMFGIDNSLSKETIDTKLGCRCEGQFNSRLQFGKGLIIKLTNRILMMMKKNDYQYNNNIVNQTNVKQIMKDLLEQTQKQSDWLDLQSKAKHQYLLRYFKDHMNKHHAVSQSVKPFNQLLKMSLTKYQSQSQMKQNLKILLQRLEPLQQGQKRMSIIQFCLSFFIYLNESYSKQIIQIFKSHIGQESLYFINFKDEDYPIEEGYPSKQYKIQYLTEIKLKNIIHSLIEWQASLEDNIVYVLKVVQSIAYKKDLVNPLAIDYKFPHCKNIQSCEECLKKTILICSKMLKVAPNIQAESNIKKFSQFKAKLAQQYQHKFNEVAKNNIKDNLLRYQLSNEILPIHIRLSFDTFSCCVQFINELCMTYNSDAVKVIQSVNKQISVIVNKLVKIRCSWKSQNIVKQYLLKFINYPLSIKNISALYLDVETSWIKQNNKEAQQILEPFKSLLSQVKPGTQQQ